MDRAELQDSARKAFGDLGLQPAAKVVWTNLSDLGWFMMAVPEAQGGLGLGPDALASINLELGRVLAPGPAIAQMLVIAALAQTGQEALLARAMAGECMTTDLCHALDADRATGILLVSEERIALAAITTATPQATWDESRRLFDVTTGAETVLASGPEAASLARLLQARLLLMLAADSVGGAAATLEMTIAYLKTRRQFDRPIAMFQALKHRVADLKVALSAAEALLWSCTGESVSLPKLGALKAHCAATFRQIAEEAIQLHGGIGLTQEHPCHRFFKRAFLNSALGGNGDHWEEIAGRAVLADR